VGDEKDIPAVSAALAKSGPMGYVITKANAEIDVVSSSASGATLPQRELIALADQQCDQFILGQTLTGGTDNSGSRSLGEVHQGTLDGVIDGIVDFVGGILTHQLIPAIVAANWGDDMTEMPSIWGKREEKEDVKMKAERMELIKRIGVPMTNAYVYEELGIPVPAPGDELFESAPPDPVSDPVMDEKLPAEKPPAEKPTAGKPPAEEVNAGLAEEKFDEMAEHLKGGKTLDWQALAVLMAAGFVDGAKPE
jgi:phage gp29-like protein